ncbi:DotA/TraY family protein [Roseovarius nubinhibens]|nr:DotA/TraY family protein [Roseovarius nubinhibens]
MTFFVTGMLILIGEALVAAPIWAFMHIRMDGQEFVDQVQKPGYMIAFNLFLRPTLAIFDIILSLTIFSGAIFFLNETFNIAAAAAIPNDRGIAVFGVISMFLIQLFLRYQLAIRSFQLITQVPDRVARWFGQGGENLNEEQYSRNAVAILNNQAEQRTQMTSGVMKTNGMKKDESDSESKNDTSNPRKQPEKNN